jgi:hypothetical protein
MTENSKKSQKESGRGRIKSGIIQLKKSDHIFVLFTSSAGIWRMSIDTVFIFIHSNLAFFGGLAMENCKMVHKS